MEWNNLSHVRGNQQHQQQQQQPLTGRTMKQTRRARVQHLRIVSAASSHSALTVTRVMPLRLARVAKASPRCRPFVLCCMQMFVGVRAVRSHERVNTRAGCEQRECGSCSNNSSGRGGQRRRCVHVLYTHASDENVQGCEM